jgi:hypothetical protein
MPIYLPRPSPEYSCGKGNLLYAIRAASFVSIVVYLIHIYVPDKYHPDHFMPWIHPFTSVIAEPTGSGFE